MNKFIVVLPFFFLWIYTEAQTFEQMEQEATTAFRSQDFLQAAAIIDKAYPLFPDKHYSMTTDLAYIYMMAGQPGKSVDALARATAEGLWFVIDTTRHWKPLAAVNGLKPLMATWSARQSEKMAQSRMKLDVVLPKNYDAQKAWPLMLAFHGHGENTDFHKKYWHSGLTDSLFIVAFVQSSLVVGPDHYGWNDWDRSRREIAEAYRSVVATYSVDTSQVMATGFSWGATMAVDMTLNQRIPATSFIALCPGLPFPIADEQIKKAASLHVAGVIITGDADQSLPDQKRISRQMTNAGMNNSVMVSPAQGHWYPDDISRQIDLAIKSLQFYREK